MIARAHIAEPPPLRFGLMLGDVLHNWRSALDNLAYQLVLLGGRTPRKRETVGFPIFDTERSFNTVGVKRIRGTSKNHADFIEGLQPYTKCKASWSPMTHALHALSTYANADKHRAINASFVAFGDPQETARSLRREPVEAEFTVEVDPVGFNKLLEDGMEVLRMRPSAPVPQPKVKMEMTLSAEIAFGEGLAMKALPAIRAQIARIVGHFGPDFP